MFETLTNRLSDVFKNLRGRGRLSDKDVEAAMREIKLALLEADVNFKVVKDFIAGVKDKAVGEEILKSLTPGQQVVKLVSEELTSLMGGSPSKLVLAESPPTVIMLVGLQGTGKTSLAAKLGFMYRSEGKKVLLAAADTYRPAAVQQLEALGKELGIDVFKGEQDEPVLKVAERSYRTADKEGYSILILDTAGRLHIDEDMMDELKSIKAALKPYAVLFVADAMTGQDAVNQALQFEKSVGFDGVVLTKLDGDARGGAALSVKAVTGKPVMFVGTGEKPRDMEVFYPDRMASRIIGMGDVLSLIEKAETAVDKQDAEEMARKMLKDEFTLDDFLVQLDQVSQMGAIDELVKMLPAQMAPKGLTDISVSENDLCKIKAIIQSMTKDERSRPKSINGSRRARIARGSGTMVGDVNKLLKQFEQMKKMMKSLTGRKGKFKPVQGF